jgi:DNA-binding MarR family transcriptional regulator
MDDLGDQESLHERFRIAYWQVWRGLDVLRLQQWERSTLTLPQLRVLYQVRRSPGIRTGELTRTMGITTSTTSGLVTKLVDAGLAARRVGAEDRRQILLELTEAGCALAGRFAGVTRPFLDSLAKGLGSDLEQMADRLETPMEAAARVRG